MFVIARGKRSFIKKRSELERSGCSHADRMARSNLNFDSELRASPRSMSSRMPTRKVCAMRCLYFKRSVGVAFVQGKRSVLTFVKYMRVENIEFDEIRYGTK
jgi:hypothetical protein